MVYPSATVLHLGANQLSVSTALAHIVQVMRVSSLDVSVIGHAAFVVDLLEERCVEVDRFTIFLWVQKFEPEIARSTERYLRRSSLD